VGPSDVFQISICDLQHPWSSDRFRSRVEQVEIPLVEGILQLPVNMVFLHLLADLCRAMKLVGGREGVMAGYWRACCPKTEATKWNAVVVRRPSARVGRCPFMDPSGNHFAIRHMTVQVAPNLAAKGTGSPKVFGPLCRFNCVTKGRPKDGRKDETNRSRRLIGL
jgi:hypothetical protein